MFARTRQRPELPPDVVLSARGICRHAPRPDPEMPPWLKKILPKSGMAGQLDASSVRDMEDAEDDPDLEEDEDEMFGKAAALMPVSFDLRAGEGLGIAGPAVEATLTLRRILTRMLPPSE